MSKPGFENAVAFFVCFPNIRNLNRIFMNTISTCLHRNDINPQFSVYRGRKIPQGVTVYEEQVQYRQV